LFTRLVASFAWAYGWAKLGFGSYNFFEDRDRNRKRARWIRTTALQMGGVIIKVGQFLSTRVDLLPDEYIEELSLLQDEVPAVPFEQVQAVVEASFEQPLSAVFARFEPVPIAAASLGQVHRAVLWGGQQVVVKVKRPGIGAIVEADLSALGFVVGLLNIWTAVRRRVDLPGVLREFTTTLREELDYISEAHSAERLGVAFTRNPRVIIPRIYWSHVRRDVITLEYTPGIKITEYEKIEAAGISRSDMAEILLQTYLQQIMVEGFFHADPHPGNVFARPGPTLVLVDFGMVGRLTPRMRENVRDVFIGIVKRDFNSIVRALVRLRFVRPGADLTLIRRTVIWTIDTFHQMSFAQLRDVDPRDVLDQTYDVFRAEAFQIPTNFAFLGRALGTLSGLCTGLDPAFQFASVAEPYARELMAGGRSAGDTVRALRREGHEMLTTALALPRLGQEVLEGFSDAEWLRRDLGNVSRGLVRVERMVRALMVSLIATAFLISASFLSSRYSFLAIIALVLAAVLLLRVVIFMLTSRRSGI
jgi:predicted unusual protein kinase regulating ubiquinone biosynthesis (AarF/ABC1/UbiB family)